MFLSPSNLTLIKWFRQARNAYRIPLILSLLILIGGILTIGFEVLYKGKVMPNTYAFHQNISFQKASLAQVNYSKNLTKFQSTPLTILFKGQVYTFTLDQLGITIDQAASLKNIPIIKPENEFWKFLVDCLKFKNVQSAFTIDNEQLQTTINATIVDLNMNVQDARLIWDESSKDFLILPEQIGWKTNWEEFQASLSQHIAFLDQTPLEITFTTLNPQITSIDLESDQKNLKTKLSQTTTLISGLDTWQFNWFSHLDWLQFESIKTHNFSISHKQLPSVLIPQTFAAYQTTDSNSTIKISLNSDHFTQYITENLTPELEQDPQDVTILKDKTTGKITFEGVAFNGYQIETSNLKELIEIALTQKIQTVEIPLKEIPAKINAPQELIDLGIKELIATGYTGYFHSTANRKTNIAVAMSRFEGIMVAPGEKFSFDKQLGVVDGSTGFVKELVIKEDRTIPEYGGGVCQVSSTMFRAIVFGGFPIVIRHPHSYAVSYYSYPDGWGLDATVYPPLVDLVFENDTGHSILIQPYLTGNNEAYFKFYGTSDHRKVELDGPYISNRHGAPAVQYIETDELAPGEKKKIDGAVNGFTATWYRTVTYADGRVVKETIVSPYEARGEKWLMGKEVTTTEGE
ncbi:MAG: hypothetical protein UT55_C0004G0011 [Candidatus Peregrinibacteria bacterium GW2011_GWE2_39_6]|nr:MAG: hypothetical protein UT36_C0004G0076 [Candidatus Peregrinibacteria bacterium GW2011_GWF2_39_17]KKR26647.1 MAG: hypothetical protein UT55_C0004G0011 [Candidatus Peregrinibacteria bacterium GW2011_GWE2_39_6]HCW32236.1 hypothetical protein [Candidatus Peregrinibacteria bacterium]